MQVPVKQNWIVLSYERHQQQTETSVESAHPAATAGRAGLFSNTEKKEEKPARDIRFGISQ